MILGISNDFLMGFLISDEQMGKLLLAWMFCNLPMLPFQWSHALPAIDPSLSVKFL
jgi:hypothetical protein